MTRRLLLFQHHPAAAPPGHCRTRRDAPLRAGPQADLALQMPRNSAIKRLMLLCICNSITEEEVREIARHGVTDPEAAYAVLGKTPQCRICLDHADDVIASVQTGPERRCGGAGRRPSAGLSAPA